MKRLLLLILIILIPSALFALTAPQIYFASDDALRNMVAMRNLAEGTREEMQAALYDFEGLDAYTINNDTENPESTDGGFLLTINGSENLAREEGRVVLTGNSSISMTDNGVLSELSADTIIIDMDNSRLTALENVNYSTDDESASIQDIEADIVTVTWDSGALMVTNATTETVSGEEGSADAITIYTSGETLSYSPDKGMLYNDGFITSNKEEAYVSITADEIALLSGADMFVTDAYLSIGRVPILWLPFFFSLHNRYHGIILLSDLPKCLDICRKLLYILVLLEPLYHFRSLNQLSKLARFVRRMGLKGQEVRQIVGDTRIIGSDLHGLCRFVVHRIVGCPLFCMVQIPTETKQ